jgi:hypothetical protein
MKKDNEVKDEMKVKIKGGPKFWQKFLKKLDKAKKEGNVSCGGTCCK